MMCGFGEFSWVFVGVGVLAGLLIAILPTDTPTPVALTIGGIGILAFVLAAVAPAWSDDLQCKEARYQSVLDRRPELVRECPDREKPSCQLKWIRYQKDSLDGYLRVLQ